MTYHVLIDSIGEISHEHRQALHWFGDMAGQQRAWREIQLYSESETRLVNQAKGIYKPKYTDYALSIRTIQDGPYPDKEVEFRHDGTWVLAYCQENPDPAQRDREATNRGLMKCMADMIPVGVLIKRKPKPGVAYEVLGLGYVVAWESGYFVIEGISPTGVAHSTSDPDATRMRATIHSDKSGDDFDAEYNEDHRTKALSLVTRRQGQGQFRLDLMSAYKGACCITGCRLKHAIDAAHINGYQGNHSQHVQNGMILRSDLHDLFDEGLIAIDEEYRIVLSAIVKGEPCYAELDGKPLNLPENPAHHPSMEAIKKHKKWAGL